MARQVRALNTLLAARQGPFLATLILDAFRALFADPGLRRGRLFGGPWSTGDRWIGHLQARDRSA